MSIIKKIDFDSVERTLKNVVEVASQARLVQEQLEATLVHIANNETYFRSYGTSKATFEGNREYLEKEKKRFTSEITKSVRQLLKNADNLERKIGSCKI
jgi:hypothetical protein